MKYSIVVPVYNEEESIIPTIKKIQRTMKDKTYEIIVVNDGSTDNTLEKLKEVEFVRVYSNHKNMGYGYTLRNGIKRALGDWIIITDADGTYPFDRVADFFQYEEEYDMIIGSRTGGDVHVPFMRKPAKWILKHTAQFITKREIPDINSGLRMFKKDLCYKFWRMYPNGFSFTSTLTIASLVNEYDVKWIPIDYYKRVGKSTINPIKDFINFIFLIMKSSLYFSPLRLFLPVSAVTMLAGITKAVMDYHTSLPLYGVHKIGEFALTLITVSILVALLGILADLINRRQPR